VAWRGVRSTATLTLSRDNSRRADLLSTAFDDLSTAAEVRQRSLALSLSHRLTPSTTANLDLNQALGLGNQASLSHRQRGVALRLGGTEASNIAWSLTGRRTLYDDSGAGYAETALIATLGLRF
jgi:uncharacterized protein (PEP-CTERM system associated)